MIMNDTLIKIENLSKKYRIGTREGYKTFRETLVDAAKAPFIRMRCSVSKARNSLPHAPGSLLYAIVVTNKTNETNSTNQTNLIRTSFKKGCERWDMGFVLRIANRGLGFIRKIILARLLAQHDFSLLGIAMLSIATLETFSQTGFQAALIQKKKNV